jgi:hypothetical protein
MLQDRNWRHHLVACAAVLMSGDGATYAAPLWRAFDTGSWVAPQLAVTLLLADTQVDEEAHKRVVDRCRVASDGLRSLHESVRSKNFAALIGVLSNVPHEEEWILSELKQPDVRVLMAWDRDHADAIARSWLDAVRTQLPPFGGDPNRSGRGDH